MSAPDEVASSSEESNTPKSKPAREPRNLILCSDGTGARATNADGSNVWRVYQALDRDHTDPVQLAIHEDGVGSSSNKMMAALGGGLGFGLARNVRHLYEWLCTEYQEGDKIYLFGFSRGAFTVRCLAGMITRFGVLDATTLAPKDLHRLVGRVWFAYKDSQHSGAEPVSEPIDLNKNRFWTQKLADRLAGRPDEPLIGRNAPIEFIGVWDTVDAYGLPIDELKEAFAWASRKIFRVAPLHRLAMTRFNGRKLSPKIKNAYHAIAIDDERHTFHPVLWDKEGTESRWESPPPGADEVDNGKSNLQQVWFVGMHTDVGGGYPRGALSLVPLDWMMDKAARHGLVFTETMRAQLQAKMSPQGPMHDSRSGTGAYYRYKPRPVAKLCSDHGIGDPVLHESVVERIDALRGEGAPAVLPEEFQVVNNDGVLRTPTKTETPDSLCLGRLRMLHWRRRLLYFFFVLWTATLIALLFAGKEMTVGQPAPPWKLFGIGYLLSVAQRITPGFVSDAIGTLRGVPFWTLSMAAVLAFVGWRRHSLVGQIQVVRRAAWNKVARDELLKEDPWRPSDRLFKAFDSTDDWRAKNHERSLLARLVVLAVVVVFGYWMYNWFSTGVMLPGDFVADPIRIEHGAALDSEEFQFTTDNPALAIGPVWQRDEQYVISVDAGDWADGDKDAGPMGVADGPQWYMKMVTGYRDWRRPAFALLGSLGSENGETFLIGDGCRTIPLPRDTRLFVFVNDRVCYWCPSGAWHHYTDNTGRATITIRRVPKESEDAAGAAALRSQLGSVPLCASAATDR